MIKTNIKALLFIYLATNLHIKAEQSTYIPDYESKEPHYFDCFHQPECARSRLGTQLYLALAAIRLEKMRDTEPVKTTEEKFAYEYLGKMIEEEQFQSAEWSGVGRFITVEGRRKLFFYHVTKYLDEYYTEYRDNPEQASSIIAFLKEKHCQAYTKAFLGIL